MSTPGCEASAAPASLKPVTMFSTPGGRSDYPMFSKPMTAAEFTEEFGG